MKNSVLFAVWAVLYVICTLLGLVPMDGGFGSALTVFLSILFFLPGGMLVYRGVKGKNRKLLRAVRIISIASLALTLTLLVASFLSVLAPQSVGNMIHAFLTLVSTPMISLGNWFISLFLWACLLMSTLVFKKRR